MADNASEAKVSNEIKNGMVGIILLNGIYSFIITVLYLKGYNYIFEDNLWYLK